MKIGVPVGGFHEGNTAEYVLRALEELGHDAVLLDRAGLFSSARDTSFDLFLCVDSGETLSIAELAKIPGALHRTAFWFIDYRHNKHRPSRVPTDFENAKLLSEGGGWIFQAQFEDVDDCAAAGIERCSWLPMAADPDIWSDAPAAVQKSYDVVFIGNIWDEGRLRAVQLLEASPYRAALLCNGRVWKERAAAALRGGRVGFNISSWYGTEHAFDLNMRFFETLSCGVPVLTNDVPSLRRVLGELPDFVRSYASPDEILPKLRECLESAAFLGAGPAARQWILSAHTYRHRMENALRVLTERLSG